MRLSLVTFEFPINVSFSNFFYHKIDSFNDAS